jgi:hypothetical protein
MSFVTVYPTVIVGGCLELQHVVARLFKARRFELDDAPTPEPEIYRFSNVYGLFAAFIKRILDCVY